MHQNTGNMRVSPTMVPAPRPNDLAMPLAMRASSMRKIAKTTGGVRLRMTMKVADRGYARAHHAE
jgi:hypothetical protein